MRYLFTLAILLSLSTIASAQWGNGTNPWTGLKARTITVSTALPTWCDDWNGEIIAVAPNADSSAGPVKFYICAATNTWLPLAPEGRKNPIAVSGTSTTLNFALGNLQHLTLTSSVSTMTLSNIVDGANYEILVTQGGSGSFTITWPVAVKWPGGTAPTLSTTAGKTDMVRCVVSGSNLYCDSFLDVR